MDLETLQNKDSVSERDVPGTEEKEQYRTDCDGRRRENGRFFGTELIVRKQYVTVHATKPLTDDCIVRLE